MTTTQTAAMEGSVAPPGLMPASPTVGYSVRRHWFLVLVTVLVFVGAGAAVGLVRDPVYTARAKLTVGRINLSAPGALSGYSQASQALASGYSRAVDADAVVLPVAREANRSAQSIRDHISASPVPESPVFRVQATGEDKADTIRLANLASSSLLAYLTDLNRSTPDSTRLYARYESAARRVNSHRVTQKRLAEIIAASKTPSSELRAALVRSKTAADAAALRAQALRQAYVTSLASQSNTELVQLLAPATTAPSDRRAKLELALFAGLVAGLLVGAGLASLRTRRTAV